jgi:hypothetical protein
MQIFGHDVISPSELWNLYKSVSSTPNIWRPDCFAASAKQSGLKRISARQGYYSFSGPYDLKGQAVVLAGHIEEMRLFIGNAPKDVNPEVWESESQKIPAIAYSYSEMFQRELGSPYYANKNTVFEYDGHRIRVLATNSVWVVLSNFAVIDMLPNYWWPSHKKPLPLPREITDILPNNWQTSPPGHP